MSKTEWTSNRQARPEAAGYYLVTLERPGLERIVSAGGTATRLRRPMYRSVERMRLAGPGDYSGWPTMGEDRKKYHWVDQSTKASDERVVAWMGPIEPPEAYREELTDGYEYVWE